MSSVLQNQLLKVEKGLLVCCLGGRGRLAGGSGRGQIWKKEKSQMEKRSKGSNGVRDGSDWEREEKGREGVRWKKRRKGTGGEEGREGGDTGRSCTGFASHGMICN